MPTSTLPHLAALKLPDGAVEFYEGDPLRRVCIYQPWQGNLPSRQDKTITIKSQTFHLNWIKR